MEVFQQKSQKKKNATSEKIDLENTGPNFCTKFDALNDFLKRRASYHFKAYEVKITVVGFRSESSLK